MPHSLKFSLDDQAEPKHDTINISSPDHSSTHNILSAIIATFVTVITQTVIVAPIIICKMQKSTPDIPFQIHELHNMAPVATNHHSDTDTPLTNTISCPCTKDPIMIGTPWICCHHSLYLPEPTGNPHPLTEKKNPKLTNLFLSMNFKKQTFFLL
jgi:hypothetical protein